MSTYTPYLPAYIRNAIKIVQLACGVVSSEKGLKSVFISISSSHRPGGRRKLCPGLCNARGHDNSVGRPRPDHLNAYHCQPHLLAFLLWHSEAAQLYVSFNSGIIGCHRHDIGYGGCLGSLDSGHLFKSA